LAIAIVSTKVDDLIMAEKVSTINVRQRIGDMLNRIALGHDGVIIERNGKPLAALVPVERLAQMQRFARRQALDFMEVQEGGPLSEREAEDLALEAQRAASRTWRTRRSAHRLP
jgi:prevent-host-death family protein